VEAIALKREQSVARILINQPAKRNAINRAMWRSIKSFANQMASDETIRLCTLESAIPGCFAAGADISEFEQNYKDAATTDVVNAEIYEAIEAVAICPQPTVALIDGPCIGGGLALALACDFRLASSNAEFAVTPSRLGLSYHPSDMQRLLRAVGHSAASEMAFTSLRWSAERALQAGLVNSVSSDAEFAAQTTQIVDAICANSLDANRILKKTIADVESGESERFGEARQDFFNLFSSSDFHEGRDAFLAKQPARFPSNKT